MIWRDLIFDYLWERASPLGRCLIIAVLIGAVALVCVAIFRLGDAERAANQMLRGPITTSFTSPARKP